MEPNLLATQYTSAIFFGTTSVFDRIAILHSNNVGVTTDVHSRSSKRCQSTEGIWLPISGL